MHVARTSTKYVDKTGNVRHYESLLVRRTFREGAKVRHETLANLSKLPAKTVAAIEATLKGQTLVAAGSEFTIARCLQHGDHDYMGDALDALRAEGYPVTEEAVGHLTPAQHDHINFYGTYHFDVESELRRQGHRPLRSPAA